MVLVQRGTCPDGTTIAGKIRAAAAAGANNVIVSQCRRVFPVARLRDGRTVSEERLDVPWQSFTELSRNTGFDSSSRRQMLTIAFFSCTTTSPPSSQAARSLRLTRKATSPAASSIKMMAKHSRLDWRLARRLKRFSSILRRSRRGSRRMSSLSRGVAIPRT